MKYAIDYTIGEQDWYAHNVPADMVALEVEHIQDIENGTIIAIRREV